MQRSELDEVAKEIKSTIYKRLAPNLHHTTANYPVQLLKVASPNFFCNGGADALLYHRKKVRIVCGR